MPLFISYYTTCGLVLVILLLFLKYCRNTLKNYEGYSILYIIPYMVYSGVFRKVPKDMTWTNFAFKKFVETCMQHMKEGCCIVYIAEPMVVIFGEEPLKIFSNAKFAANKSDLVYHIIQDTIGPGLLTNSGEKWKKQRKMLNPVFGSQMLKDNVPLFNEHALAFVKDLEKLVGKPSVNLLDTIKCHYFNALSESIFGLKQTEENRAENLKYFHNIDTLFTSSMYRIGRPWLQWEFMLRTFSYGRQILRGNEDVFSFTKNLVLKMKQHITSNQTSDPEDFNKSTRKSLTYILLQHHLNDPSFSFEDLRGEASNFMLAGFDTVSTTTMWCLFMLGLYPEVQEKAYNEVQFASKENYISYEDCSNFTYLESVLLETLRLYPPVPFFVRQPTQDVQCGKLKILKNTMVTFSPYVLHRNPDIYPDPETFDPERFLRRKENKSWTYIPFSEGYRNCIGKKYALIEMKIFLAYFLRNFKITSLDRREDIELRFNLILLPAKPLRMHIERR